MIYLLVMMISPRPFSSRFSCQPSPLSLTTIPTCGIAGVGQLVPLALPRVHLRKLRRVLRLLQNVHVRTYTQHPRPNPFPSPRNFSKPESFRRSLNGKGWPVFFLRERLSVDCREGVMVVGCGQCDIREAQAWRSRGGGGRLSRRALALLTRVRNPTTTQTTGQAPASNRPVCALKGQRSKHQSLKVL